MADNNSSSNVATVAIVIILVAAAFGAWYFINHGGLKTSSDTTKVQISLPSTDSAPAK